jgi:hypothetical protein
MRSLFSSSPAQAFTPAVQKVKEIVPNKLIPKMKVRPDRPLLHQEAIKNERETLKTSLISTISFIFYYL